MEMLLPVWGSAHSGTTCGSPSLDCDSSNRQICHPPTLSGSALLQPDYRPGWKCRRHGFGVSHRGFGGFSLLAAPGSPAEAVSWQHQLLAPRSRSAALYLWREVCMSPEQAQGKQLRVPSIILEIFHLLGEKRWVMGRLDFPEILSGGGSAPMSVDLVPTMLPFPSLRQTQLPVFPGEHRDLPNLLLSASRSL